MEQIGKSINLDLREQLAVVSFLLLLVVSHFNEEITFPEKDHKLHVFYGCTRGMDIRYPMTDNNRGTDRVPKKKPGTEV